MVTLRVRIVASSESREEVVAALLSLVGPVRSQPGCTATRVLREMDEDDAVEFEAEWRSRPDLEHHFGTAAFRTLLATMELASRKPEFEVDVVGDRLGFEVVEAVFGSHEVGSRNGTHRGAPGR